MLILLFDTYITSNIGSLGGLHNFSHIELATSKVRNNFPTYKYQRKIDVVKYTLCSYANIDWDYVIIRFECEEKTETKAFIDFCRLLFPGALIQNQRSSTAFEYNEILTSLLCYGNPWIFFSPNNDHPYLTHPYEIKKFISISNSVEHINKDKNVCLQYSHFTESMIDNKISDPQWGYHGSNFKNILFEDENIIITHSNRMALDSIKIFRLNFLINIFSKTSKRGRVIRLEDTEFHLQRSNSLITIAPKIELCRHYDSYSHLIPDIPPLFIPVGFFENNIKIKYGYNNSFEGYVNINPLDNQISKNTDLNCLLEDIPYFWKDRVVSFDINPNYPKNLNKNNIIYYRKLINPFFQRSKYFNISRSFILLIIHPFVIIKNLFLYSFLSRFKLRKNYNLIKSKILS